MLRTVAELTAEVKTGTPPPLVTDLASARNGFRTNKGRLRHQTDVFALLHKPRPRPAMTK